MDPAPIEKKLREAEYFLQHMATQSRKAFGDRERFDFYLSAFLSAGRSVEYRLRHACKPIDKIGAAKIQDWIEEFRATCEAPEVALDKFMCNDRAEEVHEAGSSRSLRESTIPVYDSYSDASGTLQVCAPPAQPWQREAPPAEVVITAYHYKIDGTERAVLEAARDWLAYLKKMTARFVEAGPSV